VPIYIYILPYIGKYWQGKTRRRRRRRRNFVLGKIGRKIKVGGKIIFLHKFF
jgi:hypothetical protein